MSDFHLGIRVRVTSFALSAYLLALDGMPTPPEEQGLGTRAGCPGGRRRREAAGEWSGKAEKGQARRRYFNLINDRTPLRVCFNNQDTLQQVDRMFAVNLHMSSARAVSINNV